MGTAAGRAGITAGGVAPCVKLLQPSAAATTPAEQAALHLHALAVLEALAAEPEGDAAVAAAAPWASLTRLIAGAGAAADVPPAALRLAHALVTDGARCRGLVDAGGVAAVLPLLCDESFMSTRRAGAARQQLERGLGVLAAISRNLALADLGGARGAPVVSAIATVCAEHAAEPGGALAASSAVVLRSLAADRESAKVILAAGGARGLAQLAHGLGAEGGVQADAHAALALLAPEVCGRFVEQMRGSPLLLEPTFWTEPVCGFLTARVAKQYTQLVAASGDFFFELFHFCALVTLRQGRAEDVAPADAAKDIMEMLEMFENEPAALKFLGGIFGDVTARAKAAIADFDAFDIEAP